MTDVKMKRGELGGRRKGRKSVGGNGEEGGGAGGRERQGKGVGDKEGEGTGSSLRVTRQLVGMWEGGRGTTVYLLCVCGPRGGRGREREREGRSARKKEGKEKSGWQGR